jgi:GT2 family glycosyltransferase
MIDIIIPTTYNPKFLYMCLDSIKKYDAGVNYNITVVDNLSIPKVEFANVNIIRKEERLCFSKAMNLGIQSTNGEYILFLNNDTIVTSDGWLKELHNCFISYEKVGIVSPVTNFICINEARCLDVNSKTNEIIKEYPGEIPAVCWFTSRKVIEDIGLFDEQFENAFDDIDRCMILKQKGYKLYIDGKVFIYHHGSKSVSITPSYYEAFQKSSNLFHKKWKK